VPAPVCDIALRARLLATHAVSSGEAIAAAHGIMTARPSATLSITQSPIEVGPHFA
jgi:hypothetical protein